jgi:dipeptidyl aminopeptidase/acylaminoacyl peptidase
LPAQAPPALFSLDAMNRIAHVSGAVISPDGRRIAYVVTRTVLERNTTVDELHVYDLSLQRDRRLRFHHESYSNAMWSSRGGLAYIADDKATDADQIFTVDGKGQERRVTGGVTDVMDAAWSPGASRFAFIRRDRTRRPTGAAAFEDAFEVGDNAYLSTHAAVSAHLWLANLNGSERRLTSGTWSVRDASPSWSSDGRYIAYVHSISATYGLRDRSFVERLDVASGKRTALTAFRALEEAPLYAPASPTIAFSYPHAGDPAAQSEVWTVSGPGGQVRDLSASLDRHVEDFAWYDASHVVLRAYDRTHVRLVVAALQGSAFRDLATGDVADAAIESQCAARDGAMVFTGSTPTHPDELYYLAATGAKPVALTHENDEIASLALARQTEVSYENGGFTQYAVLTYPPNYDPRLKYPLAVRIHGGPNLSSFVAFDPFYQYAAARGYFVLAPNYRGSTNAGNAFQRAIFRDASVGPGSDVIAAVDSVVAMNVVDAARIGVSGWSYGGQLTTWLIGHDSRWGAAVSGAGVDDLVVDYATADDIDDDRAAFGGSPFVGNELPAWRAASPIAFVDQIRTPTLILSNVYDVRVPVVESYELFHALRDRGVAVKFFVYPSAGHLPQGPVRLADAYRRWLDWFDRYLKK